METLVRDMLGDRGDKVGGRERGEVAAHPRAVEDAPRPRIEVRLGGRERVAQDVAGRLLEVYEAVLKSESPLRSSVA